MSPAMKPDDIPEDVWEAATRCAREVCDSWHSPDDCNDVIFESKCIARAIMAERNRCADIAENCAAPYRMLHRNAAKGTARDHLEASIELCSIIAAAIRQER